MIQYVINLLWFSLSKCAYFLRNVFPNWLWICFGVFHCAINCFVFCVFFLPRSSKWYLSHNTWNFICPPWMVFSLSGTSCVAYLMGFILLIIRNWVSDWHPVKPCFYGHLHVLEDFEKKAFLISLRQNSLALEEVTVTLFEKGTTSCSFLQT